MVSLQLLRFRGINHSMVESKSWVTPFRSFKAMEWALLNPRQPVMAALNLWLTPESAQFLLAFWEPIPSNLPGALQCLSESPPIILWVSLFMDKVELPRSTPSPMLLLISKVILLKLAQIKSVLSGRRVSRPVVTQLINTKSTGHKKVATTYY